MLIRAFFGAVLSVLAIWPMAAQCAEGGSLTGVVIAADGTTWTAAFQVEGGKIEGDLSYEFCQSCPEADGEYYCAAQDISAEKTYSIICMSRTKTVRGDIHLGSQSVRVQGNLKRAQIDPGFYPRVDFTLLNADDYEAYRRFAADNKTAGTDTFAAAQLPKEAPVASASPPRRDSETQADRLAEERKKAEATLRELRRQREQLAGERAAAEEARRRMREERAALERERRMRSPGFRRGLAAFEKGDYAEALKEWRPLADQGDAEAQYRLGRMHEKGWGTTKDFDAALRWYRLAAEQGHEEAKKVLKILELDNKSATPISF
jgi:hypothetical protein